MFNEFYHPQSLKPSTTEYFRLESQGITLSNVTSQSGVGHIGAPLFSSGSPLYGLTSLCDQLGALSSSELSVSPSDYSNFGLTTPTSKDICSSISPNIRNSISPTSSIVANSLLGSSLHNSVSRSYSDSSRQDRAKNVFSIEPDHFQRSSVPIGWNVDRETRDSSPYINSDPWSSSIPMNHTNHLSLTKSHSEVFRTYSDRSNTDEETSTSSNNIHAENEASNFLWSLKKASGNKSDYDTLLKNYNNKVLFALKLGYTETLLQKALSKLGIFAEENQILEELIKLQKSKPADGTNSPLAKQLSDDRGSSSSVKTDSGVVDSNESDLLPIVIDGSNVAVSHGNKERFSCKGIKICVDWFLARGHKDITVFVPLWRKEASKPDTPISDQHILLELERDNLLSFTPSRQVSGRRFVCHDDRYILNLASETGAIVVSNDNYRDLVNEKPDYKKVIEEKILMYTFVNDRFMPPDDPFGRNGPTLDAFLRRPKYGHSSNTQPCPYEKKCTYGNKCKFYHADRGNVPQKSITDKLKENSSKRINEVRARSPSNESGTGDQLMRTKSMQPMSSSDASRFATKKALARTKSLNPNLERSLQQQQQQQQQQHNIWPHISNHFLDADRSTLPPVWNNQQNMVMINPPASGNQQNLVMTSGVGEPVKMFSVDTSKPPPPPGWPQGDISSNAHRKLARQLTLNPTSDPRIHGFGASRYMSEANDQFSYPPPSMIGNFQHQHFAVKRNASAPEPSSQHLSRSPIPNLVQIEGEVSDIFSAMHRPHPSQQQQQQQQQLQQGYVRRDRRPMQLPLQISSDNKLCKSKSE